jgi:hypothetical protein
LDKAVAEAAAESKGHIDALVARVQQLEDTVM